MYLAITAISDAELLARRTQLDQVIQSNLAELTLLNRENDRRERARHEAAQAAVIAAEGKPVWERDCPTDETPTTDAPTGFACSVPDVVVAAGDGVVVQAA